MFNFGLSWLVFVKLIRIMRQLFFLCIEIYTVLLERVQGKFSRVAVRIVGRPMSNLDRNYELISENA